MIEVPLTNGGVTLISDEDEHLTVLPWTRNPKGYVTRIEGPRHGRRHSLRLHRVILGVTDPAIHVDHKDRDRLNNQRDNLRILSLPQNSQNLSPRSGTSVYRGVGWWSARERWKAAVKLNQKQYHLGYFEVELDAARAAEAFRRKHMPFAVPEPSLDPVPPCSCRCCK
jgi:hypothetical protein